MELLTRTWTEQLYCLIVKWQAESTPKELILLDDDLALEDTNDFKSYCDLTTQIAQILTFPP